MKEILLIGNGPSVLDYQLGDTIDKFPCVVRFNLFRIQGYEKHVGTKCNIWFAGNRHRLWYDKYDYDEVFFVSPGIPPNRPFEKFRAEVPKAKLIPRWVYEDVRRKMGYAYPSSGILATYYFSKTYDKVYLYGFDHFEPDKHYYGIRESVKGRHIPEKERLFINSLKETGVVWELK